MFGLHSIYLSLQAKCICLEKEHLEKEHLALMMDIPQNGVSNLHTVLFPG